MIKDLVDELPIIWLYRLIYYTFYCAAILRFCNGHTWGKSTWRKRTFFPDFLAQICFKTATLSFTGACTYKLSASLRRA